MFYAFVMHAGGDIDWIKAFPSEAEVDEFGMEESGYAELSPDDDPDHWKKYDPPIVIVFEAEDALALENGKYTRPVAIYECGDKYVCVKSGT